ncbi:MAG: hypothetical protein ACREBI_04575 [Nitrosotalea sp.]
MTKINASVLVGVLILLAIAYVAPNAFATGVDYTAANNPHGPLQGMAWGVGMGVAGLLAGIGVFTTRMHRH